MKVALAIALALTSLGLSAQKAAIKKAETLMNNLAFAEAVEVYHNVLTESSEDVSVKLKLAKCYLALRNFSNAAHWYGQALEGNQMLPTEHMKHYGDALKALGMYDEAKRWYKLYSAAHGTESKLVASCDSAKAIMERQLEVDILNVSFNTDAAEMCPMFYKEGLVFAAERPENIAKGKGSFAWNDKPFLDMFYTPSGSAASFPKAAPMKGAVNTMVHEAGVTFNQAGTKMYFTRNDLRNNKRKYSETGKLTLNIYIATLQDGQWVDVTPFPYNNEQYSVAHPALSPTGEWLVFSSDMPGGFGGKDLYACKRNGSSWDHPINLGAKVNTEADELFPFIDADGLLYFASDGHFGLGGLDIFSAKRVDGIYQNVRNVGSPINTAADDFALIVKDNYGYLSSNREGGQGGDDIYYFASPSAAEVIFIKKKKTLTYEGVVLDDDTRNPVPNVNVIFENITTGKQQDTTTGPDGRFLFEYPEGDRYRVIIMKPGHFTHSEDVTSEGDSLNDIEITDYVVNEPILIENIYYDLDDARIRTDAMAELNKLVKLLTDNPSLEIEIMSHTDSRAKDAYNMRLSTRRAQSVVRYLIEQGVNPARLESRGYGESKLVNNCDNDTECAEELHQKNRRTEFKVTGFTDGSSQFSIPK